MERNPILKKAFFECALEEFADIPEITHVFSEKFERKMRRLIKNQRSSLWTYFDSFAKKAVAVCLTLSVVFGFAMTVDGIREEVVRFFIEIYEECTNFIFPKDDSENPVPDTIEDVYMFEYIPEGYELVSEGNFVKTAMHVWLNDSGEKIVLQQWVQNSSEITLDTEDVKIEEFNIKNQTYYYFTKNGTPTISWLDSEYLYIISYNDLSKDELVKMINSMSIVK